MSKNFTDKHKKTLAGAGVLAFLLITVAVFIYIGEPIMKAASNPEEFRALIKSYGFWGKFVFAGMVILQVFVAIIPGEPLEIAAGYTFGAFWGTALCLIGIGIGSILVLLFVRRFGMRAVEVFFSREKIEKLGFLKDSQKLRALTFLLLFIPGTPKDLVCYLAGLTDMKLTEFFIISVTARVPSVITSTVGGDALGLKNYTFAVIVFALTALISVAGILIYKRVCAKKETKQ